MEPSKETENILPDQLSVKLRCVLELIDECNRLEEPVRSEHQAAIHELIQGDEESEALLTAVIRALEAPTDEDSDSGAMGKTKHSGKKRSRINHYPDIVL